MKLNPGFRLTEEHLNDKGNAWGFLMPGLRIGSIKTKGKVTFTEDHLEGEKMKRLLPFASVTQRAREEEGSRK
jgi:hypothetical protein